MLHHGIIDGLARRRGQRGFIQHAELQVDLGLRHRARRRVGDGGLELRDLGLHYIGAEDEVPGIPEAAFGDVSTRGRLIGLFNEGGDLEGAGRLGDGSADTYIAVTRRRARGLDAQRYDAPGGGGLACLHAQGEEFGWIGDGVVGGERREDDAGPLAARQFGGDRHGGG